MSVPGKRRWGWPACRRLTWQRAVLWTLVLVLTIAVAVFDPRDWPYTVGDEGVYSMQAQSLAFDFDRRYEASDYRRYLDTTGKVPDPLILQSTDRGATLVYAKPAFYSVYLAPFVRFAPERGPIVANLLLLIFAALLLECLLFERVGADGPLVAAFLLFFSVTFGHVFWVHADLFYLVVTAMGLCCLDPWFEGVRPPPGRLAAGGGLLAVAGAGRPFYLAVLAAVLLAAAPTLRRSWGRRSAAIVLGSAIVLLAGAAWFHLASGGAWSPYVGERQGFSSATGYPDIDFDREGWAELLAARGDASWVREDFLLPSFDAALLGHNVVYAFLGRSVGIVPYFLPLVLACLCLRPGSRRRWLLVAIALGLAAFLVKSPHNFYGGAGAIANRWFLPLYPVCWFLVERPPPRRWLLASSLVAALFVAPQWRSAASFPVVIDPDTGSRQLRYVSPAAKRLLPLETSQIHLSSAPADIQHGDLRVRLIGAGVWPHGEGGIRFRPGTDGEMLIGSPVPLAGLTVDLVPVEANGGEATRVVLERPRRIARHTYWYGGIPLNYYRLELPGIPMVGEREVLLQPEFRWD
ncbi:MAG: hypothetical protein OXG81_01575 [Acidobacteria bacterium]|nr:hypothetical protein [Acidobacteriota bacterium]